VPSAVDRGVVEQRILEESSRLPGTGAVTGWAALRLHGVGFFDGLGADGISQKAVALVVPPPARLRPATGIEVHRDGLSPDEIIVLHGIPATRAERAAFDEARAATDLRQAVVSLDTALAANATSRAAMKAYLATKVGRRGVSRVLAALDLADDRSLSPKESVLRLIWCLDAGLPRPKMNWPVADEEGRFIGRPDLLCEELAVIGEFDGALHRSRARHRDDLRRDDQFRAVGLEPFRVVGADLADLPLVLGRIRRAVERAASSNVPRTWRLQANPRPVA
jgi:hypothetical protein